MLRADSPHPIDDRFLHATRQVVAEHGLEGATLERIARAAGVSRVTLHRRGVTKGRIVAALLDRAVEDYRRAMWPALTAPGSARQRLEAGLTALCEVAEANLGLLAQTGPPLDAVFHEEGDETLTRSTFTEPLERLLRDGVMDHSLRDADPRETATLLFNLVGQTYIHLRLGHRWNPERARARLVDIALAGLLPR